jgi:hypothetical protein
MSPKYYLANTKGVRDRSRKEEKRKQQQPASANIGDVCIGAMMATGNLTIILVTKTA